jgi:hypothetical protein
LIKQYAFPYIALNPGASYRGLHDSLVNYGENQPPMLLCNHEKIAVQIAHGYAKASGKPMIAIVHNVVGLLHAPMGIYYAYIDRSPVFLSAPPGRWTRNTADRSSTGFTPPSLKATPCASSPNGITSPAAFTACRTPSRAPIRS